MAEFNPDAYLAAKTAPQKTDFDPDQYLKKFDPDQYLKAQGVNAEPKTSAGAAFNEHQGNAITMGYLPQLQAKAEPITDRIYKMFTGDKTTEPAPMSQLTSNDDNYVKARDANVKRIDQEHEDHPYAANAGTVGGSVASALAIPIPGASGPASLATKGLVRTLGEGAVVGTGMGALQNPGDVPGKVDTTQTNERLEDAKTGFKAGAATAAATRIFGNVLGKMSGAGDAARKVESEQAIKQSGGMLKDFRQLDGRDETEEFGQFLRKNDLVNAGDTAEDVANKAENLKNIAGQKLNAIYNKAKSVFGDNSNIPKEVLGYDAPTEFSQYKPNANTTLNYDSGIPARQTIMESPTVMNNKVVESKFPNRQITDYDREPVVNNDVDKIVSLPTGGRKEMPGLNLANDKADILQQVKSKLGVNVDGKAALNKVSNYLDDLIAEKGSNTLDPMSANEIKTAMDQKINYARDVFKKDPDVEKAFSAARNAVAQKVDAGIQAVGEATGDPKLSDALKEANKTYGYAKKAAEMAADYTSRMKGNRAVSLTDTIAGGAGSAVGGGLVAATGDHDPRHNAEGAIVGGLIGGLTNHYGRKYGPGVISSAAGNAAPVLDLAAPVAGGLSKIPPQLMTRAGIESVLASKQRDKNKGLINDQR